MSTLTSPDIPMTFDIYKSHLDGTWVVHVDTTEDVDENEQGPILRVYLNDEVLHENPEYPGGGD